MQIYIHTQKLSSAFNPSRLAPGAPRPWQGGGLTPLQLLVSPIFEWQEWESNRQPSGYWMIHSNH